MSGQEATLVGRLGAVLSQMDVREWKDQDGYYTAACRVSAADVPQLIEIVRRWSDPEWMDDGDEVDIPLDDAELLPVVAWRTLADMQADEAAQPLVDMVRDLGDEFSDWVSEELPLVFGKIGVSAIEPLTRLANDPSAAAFGRSVAARGLRCVAESRPETRNQIVAVLTELMAGADADSDINFNSTLLMELVDLRGVEAAEPIERAFANNLLDIGVLGDWETVRLELGVEGLGLKMPEHPYNSFERFCLASQAGIFSDEPVVTSDGEVLEDAAEDYRELAHDLFSQSVEAQAVIDRYRGLGWFQSFLDFGLNYRGEIVDEMTLEAVEEFVLDYTPRKISVAPEAAAEIIMELTQFWKFLDRVFNHPAAKEIVAWLSTDGLVAELKAELADSSNFGMAKSFFAMGQQAGFDMTTEAGLAQFVAAYNNSLSLNSSRSPVGPPAEPPGTFNKPELRVGRNDPCPCGSGKKFKKCCHS